MTAPAATQTEGPPQLTHNQILVVLTGVMASGSILR